MRCGKCGTDVCTDYVSTYGLCVRYVVIEQRLREAGR